MSKAHEVATGECIGSIAFEEGFSPSTIWGYGENASLKQLRKDQNILMEGDVVHIPDKAKKQESRGTDARHKFKKKATHAKFQVIFEMDGKARANLPFEVTVGTLVIKGNTDGDGLVKVDITPDAATAMVVLKPKDAPQEVYEFQLGSLCPADTTSGQKARLQNLGFYEGAVDEEITPAFERAIAGFRRAFKIKETGKVGSQTWQKIKSEHRS